MTNDEYWGPPVRHSCFVIQAMETSLHRALKSLYAGRRARFEVRVGKYRIDVVSDGRLVEIQHGSLSAIRDKVRSLLNEHHVTVVKPIVVRKVLVKRAGKGGEVTDRRASPKRGRLWDLFDELVHFTRVFPHRRLTLEVPLIDIEEWRYPGHGRRWRWRKDDHQVEDQRLLAVRETHRLHTSSDLVELVSCPLPEPFHTGHLAESLGVDRWIAQRIAYCLRQTGVVRQVGKQGNALLYEFADLECRQRAQGDLACRSRTIPGNRSSDSVGEAGKSAAGPPHVPIVSIP